MCPLSFFSLAIGHWWTQWGRCPIRPTFPALSCQCKWRKRDKESKTIGRLLRCIPEVSKACPRLFMSTYCAWHKLGLHQNSWIKLTSWFSNTVFKWLIPFPCYYSTVCLQALLKSNLVIGFSNASSSAAFGFNALNKTTFRRSKSKYMNMLLGGKCF